MEEPESDDDMDDVNSRALESIPTAEAGREVAAGHLRAADGDAEYCAKISCSLCQDNLYDSIEVLPSSSSSSVDYIPKQIMAEQRVTDGVIFLVQWEDWPDPSTWTWETEAAMMEDATGIVMAWNDRERDVKVEASLLDGTDREISTEAEQ